MRWVELAVLSSFAFTQPLLSAVGGNATFLVAHQATGIRLAVFAIIAVVVPTVVSISLDELLLGIDIHYTAPLFAVF